MGVRLRSKDHPCSAEVAAAVEGLVTLRHVIDGSVQALLAAAGGVAIARRAGVIHLMNEKMLLP